MLMVGVVVVVVFVRKILLVFFSLNTANGQLHFTHFKMKFFFHSKCHDGQKKCTYFGQQQNVKLVNDGGGGSILDLHFFGFHKILNHDTCCLIGQSFLFLSHIQTLYVYDVYVVILVMIQVIQQQVGFCLPKKNIHQTNTGFFSFDWIRFSSFVCCCY